MQSLEPVWLALHIAGGQVGLPLAVLTFILASRSSGRPRYLTLINFCITWIVYSISYCLLLYAGQADQNLDSPTDLCIAQASLIHGATPMAAIAGLEMVLQLWFVQRRIHRTDFPYIRKIPERWLNFMILVQPYIVFIGFSSLALGVGVFISINDIT
ncbi:hypothetical protein M0805_008629 [Coniferiporia weirii]|nr:hypothetical protein M0805_008629 [Coniferiporia weirii]